MPTAGIVKDLQIKLFPSHEQEAVNLPEEDKPGDVKYDESEEITAINAAVQAHLGHLTHQQFNEFHLRFICPDEVYPKSHEDRMKIPVLEMVPDPLIEISDEELIKVR